MPKLNRDGVNIHDEIHGSENSRRQKGGDPGRRPRRQHRPAEAFIEAVPPFLDSLQHVAASDKMAAS
jgi:hypothetical protein